MSQILQTYSSKISVQFVTQHAREHAYRPALQELFSQITKLNVVNDPKRSQYGAPDFIFLNTQKQVICYAEAKDIIVSLSDIEKGEQMGRYYGYSNLILTNSLEFRFYKNGEKYIDPIKIGKIENGKLIFSEDKFQLLEDSISAFVHNSYEPITSGSHLAKVMAGKARRIRDNVRIFLNPENDQEKSAELSRIYNVIRSEILKDLDI